MCIYANIYNEQKLSENQIFEKKSLDNRNYVFYLLRKELKKIGIHLNTEDINKERKISFEIHLNVNAKTFVNNGILKYIFLWETDAIIRKNKFFLRAPKPFSIHTWSDSKIQEFPFKKFYMPYPKYPKKNFKFGYRCRHNLCCMIASNKTNIVFNVNELYSKRFQLIKWFENNAPKDFELYGFNWNKHPPFLFKGGGRVQFYLFKILNYFHLLFKVKNLRPSWKGAADSKLKILSKFKFNSLI
jgi:hypothetical protein